MALACSNGADVSNSFKQGQDVLITATHVRGTVVKADYKAGKITVKLAGGGIHDFKPAEIDPSTAADNSAGLGPGSHVKVSSTHETGVVEKITENAGKHTVSVKLSDGKLKDYKPEDLDIDEHQSIFGVRVHTAGGLRGVIEKTSETKDGRFATLKLTSGKMEEVNMEELLVGKLQTLARMALPV